MYPSLYIALNSSTRDLKLFIFNGLLKYSIFSSKKISSMKEFVKYVSSKFLLSETFTKNKIKIAFLKYFL